MEIHRQPPAAGRQSGSRPLRYRHGSERVRFALLPREHQTGLVPEEKHGPGGLREDPILRAVRGDIGDHQQGVHARGAERRARVSDGVHAAQDHHSSELQARA